MKEAILIIEKLIKIDFELNLLIGLLNKEGENQTLFRVWGDDDSTEAAAAIRALWILRERKWKKI